MAGLVAARPRHGTDRGDRLASSRRRVRMPEPPAPAGQQGDHRCIESCEAGRLYPCPDQAAPGQSSEQKPGKRSWKEASDG